MLALQAGEDNRCPGCGGDLNVTTAAEHDDRYRHQPPLQCFRCVAFAQSHKAHEGQPYPLSLIHLVPHRP